MTRLSAKLALSCGILSACSHYQKNLQQHAAHQETQTAKWQSTETAARTAATDVNTSRVLVTNRRVITKKPDGTVIDDRTAQQVVDLAALRFVASGSASASRTGDAAKAVKDESHLKLDESKKPATSWWTGMKLGALLVVLLLVAVGLFAWRRVTKLKKLASLKL